MDINEVTLKINPNGAVKEGENIEVELRIDANVGVIEEVYILFNRQNEEVYKKCNLKYEKKEEEFVVFTGRFKLEKIGINYFCISLKINEEQKYIKINPKTGKPCITTEAWWYFRKTVYDHNFSCPSWAKGALVYHIFVDRMKKSTDNIIPMNNRVVHNYWNEEPYWKDLTTGEVKNNDFFCGDIKGIIECLDYIKSLGVDILYLSPIMKSSSNHRYDTGDYENVDPYCGTNEDFKKLCKKAHEKGMKVMLDVVFNHTGNDSKYFNEYGNYPTIGAFQSEKSPYSEWYRKENGNFKYWWGFRNLPVLDTENPEVVDYFLGNGGIIDKYYSWGIDAIRVDVADELSDEFLMKMREAVERNTKDIYILLEVWENAIEKEKYGRKRTYLLGKAGTSAMNYPFTDGIIKAIRFQEWNTLKKVLEEILTDYPEPAWKSMTNALSTHDIPRGITSLNGGGIEYGKYQWIWDIPEEFRDSWNWKLQKEEVIKENYEEAKERLKLAVALQYFLPGSPCIFYGDEVGLMGYSNPFNRRPYPWDNQDLELLEFYKQMGKIRKKIKNMEFDLDFFIKNTIIRWYNEKEELFVIVNPTNKDIKLPESLASKEIIYPEEENLQTVKANQMKIMM